MMATELHPAHAQLVADGATRILNATTTVSGNLVVGTNGPFTTLILTNAAYVTNSGVGQIGLNTAAKSNLVIVTGLKSLWAGGDELEVGHGSAANRLIISNGGTVENSYCFLGFASSSSNNVVVVTGPGSSWASGSELAVGYYGSFNQLVISNGAAVQSGSAYLGVDPGASNNTAVVTGNGSLWSGAFPGMFPLNVGRSSRLLVDNQGTVTAVQASIAGTLTVTNGGSLSDGSGQVGGPLALALVTGSGSIWTNSSNLEIDSGGQLLVTNTGVATCYNGYVGDIFGGSNAVAVVTGAASLWTNASLSLGSWGGLSNRLVVSNGGVVSAGSCNIGDRFPGPARYNVATVTDHSFLLVANNLALGNGGSANALVVTNGSKVGDYSCSLDGSNTLALVAGAGSIWTNQFLTVGAGGWSNVIIVADGGAVSASSCDIGEGANGSLALLTGPGSLLAVNGFLTLGSAGSFHHLVVSNGATVADFSGLVGESNSSNNLAIITGSGSIWTNQSDLQLGVYGPSNQLVIKNGGTVFAASVYVGLSSSNNVLTVAGGSLVATNNSGTGVLQVRGGTLNLNSGGVVTDWLEANNGTQSQTIFSGGVLQSRNTIVATGVPFIIGNGQSPATFELLGSGTHTFSNGLVIAGNSLLKGTGTISATGLVNVTNSNGGTLSLGDLIGQLTVNGNLVLVTGSTNIFKLNKGAATNDNIAGLSTVTFGGLLSLTNFGGILNNGDTFKLFSAANYAGSFGSLNAAPPATGLWWDLSRLTIDGTVRVVPATNSRPALVSAKLQFATNLVFAATGLPYGQVYVLSTTNLALPMSNWLRWSTNSFDALGRATITNAVGRTESKRFFRLASE